MGDKRNPCILSPLLTIGAMLFFRSRVDRLDSEVELCWLCRFGVFLAGLDVTKGFSFTWMVSYSSSLSSYRGKAQIIPLFLLSLVKKREPRFVSHLRARGCQVLPERLDRLRPVVFNEFRQCVVASSVTTDQKLS